MHVACWRVAIYILRRDSLGNASSFMETLPGIPARSSSLLSRDRSHRVTVLKILARAVHIIPVRALRARLIARDLPSIENRF